MAGSMLVYVAEYLTKPGFSHPDRLGTDIFWLACINYLAIKQIPNPIVIHKSDQNYSREVTIHELEFTRLCTILERNFPRSARRIESWESIIKNLSVEDQKDWLDVFRSDFYDRLIRLQIDKLLQAH